MAARMAYFQGSIMLLEDAKVSIMTHAFMYGTACFEGIRGNWNADDGQLYVFRTKEHYQRLRMSCRILRIDLALDDDKLCEITHELVARSGYTEDVYIRPIAYKSEEVIGPRMHDVADDFLVFVIPFGDYLDADAGIRCMTSTWRRVDDLGIPARAKSTASTLTPRWRRPRRRRTASTKRSCWTIAATSRKAAARTSSSSGTAS